MKLQVMENGGDLATLLAYIQESEFENFAEYLVENPPESLDIDDLVLIEHGGNREAELAIMSKLAADPKMDHAWAIAFRQRAVLDRGKVIDFTDMIEARRALRKFCADNEDKEGTYAYDAAQGSYIDDVAQNADFVVDELNEFLETLNGDKPTNGESEEKQEEGQGETETEAKEGPG